jgi:hypothetical protein
MEGRAALLGISLALNDYGPDEVPDLTPRPIDELLAWAERANEHRDQGQSLAGRDLGTLLTELQAHALTAGSADRPRTFTALVQSCILAGDVAKGFAGNIDLAVAAARRGYDMACRHGDPGLTGFAQWWWSLPLMWLTARGRASRLLTAGIDALAPSVRLRGADTLPAEMLGFLHLTAAQCTARDQRRDDARAHLDEAGKIAARIGECNSMRMHFGPTNIVLWRLAVGVELGEGGRAYDEATRTPPDVAAAALNSKNRTSMLHFDLARALVHILDQRARRRVWELDSLRRRFGIPERG